MCLNKILFEIFSIYKKYVKYFFIKFFLLNIIF